MTEAAEQQGRWWTSFEATALAACALVVGVYSNSFGGGFHFDDTHVIQQNLYIRSLENIPRFFTDAQTFSSLPPNATYRPLLSLTYAIDYAVGGGLVSWSFHLTQLLVHLAVAVCVFLLIEGVLDRALPAGANRWVALAAATLYAVHTANTETVNYLSARSDELSTLGLLGGFLMYMEWPRARRFHLHILPMLIGALAKSPAVLLGPLLLVYALLIEEGLSLGELARLRPWDRVRAALARTAPTIAAGVLAFLFVEGMNPASQTYGGPSRLVYLQTQAWVWLHYVQIFLLPVGLTADSDIAPIEHVWNTRVLVGVAAALGLLALAWRESRTPRGRVVAFGLLWFAAGLLPTSSVFPLAEMMNEHRVYLPFIGLALACAAWLVGWLAEPEPSSLPPGARARAATVAILLLSVAHGAGTFYRNRAWRSEEALWQDVVAKSPGNGRAWMNYGLTQMAVGRYPEALGLFQEAARLNPSYPHVHTNLGIVLDALGRSTEAETELRRAVALQPTFVEGRFYLARWLVQHGNAPEALGHLRRATELSPGYQPAREMTMDLLYASAQRAALAEAARATLAVLPTHPVGLAYAAGAPAFAGSDAPSIYNLGVARTSTGDQVGAAVAYRRSAELAPTGDAFNNLGWSLAQLGFFDEARAAYREALRVDPTDDRARNNLELLDEQHPPRS